MSGADVQGIEERLRELLDEARREGRQGELVPILRGFLEAEEDSARGPRAAEGDELPQSYGMIGGSASMESVFALIERVKEADVPVLVEGETGTGKELVASALHRYGKRAGKPFVAENCAAVPETLLESELFGHKRGSFTGAIADRPGHFVTADRGTIFLDEVGDMPLSMQSKLLRVLEEGEVRPVGSNRTAKVDVRVIAATNRNLEEMVRQGRFREDLYYRLNVVRIVLPPLRERDGDVRHLALHFARSIGRESGREVTLTPEALERLELWRWPGNVRELENELRRAAALSGGTIRAEDLSPHVRGS